jgi:hypothetical protein
MYLRVVATTTDILGGTTTFTSAATTAVANFNDAPVVSNAIANQGSAEDAAWSYQVPAGTFSDADADTLSYTATLSTGVVLPNWLSFNAATRTFSGTPPQDFAGNVSLMVTASDGSASVTDTFVLTVSAVEDEAVGSASIGGTAAEGGTVTASVSATDIDGSITNTAYQWQVSSNGTTGWTDLSGATAASYAIASDQSQVGKYLRVVATTTDILGGTTTFTSAATTAITSVDFAPTLVTLTADQSTLDGTAWRLQIPSDAFIDKDGDALTYSASLSDGSSLPSWLSFNASNLTFFGTPPLNLSAVFNLKLTASDGRLSASDTFVLSVKAQRQNVTGTSGNDALSGISGSMSEIRGGAGNDTLTGGSRADVAVFSGNRADYTITTVAGVTTVRDNRTGSPDGTDTLRGMNILRFADIQLFQSSAANRVILAGQAQTYFVANSEVVQGTNAAEQFIVAPGTSALVFAGNNDVVDLSGSIGSYSFARAGTQLQINDGVYTTTLGVGGSFTLRTASGSTSVAIDFTIPGGAIRLGGTQIVGSTTFDPLLAITDRSNISSSPVMGNRQNVTGTSGNDALSGISGSMSEIRGGAGNDTLTGGSRADVAVFSGNRADYTITTVAGVTTVRDNRTGSPDGTDTLRGMNILRFADIQLFQSSAANRVILAGQAQTYFVANSEVVQGTNAAEQFIVAPGTSALVFAGNNDVVDLSGSIGSYSFARAGTQLQINDGVYTTTLGVGGSFTLRTASGSTSVAIDFTIPGGAIRLGGTQIVGSTTFDPLLAITDRSNISQNAIQKDVIVTNGASYVARDDVADVFVIDASKSLAITISGFDEADRIIFTNRTSAEGALFDAGVIGDGISTITAGNASITLTNLTNDNFGNEATFESIYGANAIGYVI